MKNTIAESVFIKANGHGDKKKDKVKFTDMDIYDEEEFMQATNNRKALNFTRPLTNKKYR